MTGRHVVVVGGGLAGIAAALRAADAGARVTLLEARPRLGGATISFPHGELDVDNGQHVFLRCCTAYRGLLRRLGVEHLTTLQDRLAIPVLTPGNPPAWLRRTGLPAPLHLLGSLARYAVLPPAARLRAVPAVLALRRLDPDDPALDAQTFGAWLAAHGQGDRAVAGLWDLVTTATLNVPSGEASLGLAAMVYRTGLLTSAPAADIGLPDVPLRRLHGDPAAKALADAGGELRLRARVDAIAADAGGVTGVQVDGEWLPADAVVLAVPHDAADRLLPAGALGDRPSLAGLGTSPIVNVHAVYDRTVLPFRFAAGVGTPAQWLFDRTEAAGLGSGQYLAISVSAAGEWIDRRTEEVRDAFVPALAALLPAARGARLVDFFVTRERTATFRQAPGCRALRPGPLTATPGLFLAGSWTDTGWPATMEGAVRSGMRAADEALTQTGRHPRGTEVAA